MFNNFNTNEAVVERHTSVLTTNRVLRNTYLLLSMTLIVSAIAAFISVVSNATPMSWMGLLISFALLFGIMFTKNSPIGIVLTFAFTAFNGWILGPILNFYIHNFSNGGQLIAMALGSTGLIFLVMSGIAMNPNRDFSRLGTFLFVGLLVSLGLVLLNVFWLKLPGLQMAVTVIFALIFSGFILYDTNRIVRGGETNYVMATVSLYLNILNLFISLLQILGMFAGNRD